MNMQAMAHLQDPPAHTNRLSLAAAFCYAWGRIVLCVAIILQNQYKLTL